MSQSDVQVLMDSRCDYRGDVMDRSGRIQEYTQCANRTCRSRFVSRNGNCRLEVVLSGRSHISY